MSTAPPRTACQPDLAWTIVASHLRDSGTRVSSAGMVRLMGEFGVSQDAVRAALSRLVRREILVRLRDGRRRTYALTAAALEISAEEDRRIMGFGRRPSAEAWTVVRHMIPACLRAERWELGSQLRFLGFGSLHDATWIAVSDREREARSLARRLGVSEHVSIFVGRLAPGYERGPIPTRAWDTDDLAQHYDDYLAQFSDLAGTGASAPPSDREAFVQRINLIRTFRDLVARDPELPERFLPLSERRVAASRIFESARDALAPRADRHFLEVAVKPPPRHAAPQVEL